MNACCLNRLLHTSEKHTNSNRILLKNYETACRLTCLSGHVIGEPNLWHILEAIRLSAVGGVDDS